MLYISCSPIDNRCHKTDITGANDGKLSGKKIAVKDNIQIAGVPMWIGSNLVRGFVPTEDATVVRRILAAGEL